MIVVIFLEEVDALVFLGNFLSIFKGSLKNISLQLIDIDPRAISFASQSVYSLQRRIEIDFINHTSISIKQIDLLSSSSSTDLQIELDPGLRNSVIEAPVDIWIGDPPYIPTTAMDGLPRYVRQWESTQALDGLCPDGIIIHKAILLHAYRFSKHTRRWMLILEIDGRHQTNPLRNYISNLFGSHIIPHLSKIRE